MLACGEGSYGRLGQGNSDDLHALTVISALQGFCFSESHRLVVVMCRWFMVKCYALVSHLQWPWCRFDWSHLVTVDCTKAVHMHASVVKYLPDITCSVTYSHAGLKIKCNVFLFVEVNFSPSVFNINKSIWVLRKITKITNLLKKRFKVRHRRFVYILQVMTSYRENNDDDDQLK